MIRKMRLASSLVLYAFVTCHLLTIPFALGGLELLDQAAAWLTEPWLHSPLRLLLTVSTVVHVGLSVYALFQRNTLRMSSTDTLQYLTGFMLPIALMPHVIGISVSSELTGNAPQYSGILAYMWIISPWNGVIQAIALLITWIHGTIGLLTVLHTKRWWPKLVWLINPAVVAIPVMAMLGFVEGGRIVVRTMGESMRHAHSAVIDATIVRAELIYIALLLVILLVRYIRIKRVGKQSVILQYTDGPRIQSAAGTTILEISHLHNIPHANLCRGRGRCGTCRCRVSTSEGSLSPVDALEQQTLTRVSAAEGERLACQCIPSSGTYTVERTVAPDIGYGLVNAEQVLPTNAAFGKNT